jgi:hypothetical protein
VSEPLPVLRSPLLDEVPGLRHGFFTRQGGSSPAPWDSLNVGTAVDDEPARVEHNLACIAGALGVPRDRLLTVRQVHSARAVDAGRASVDTLRCTEADALLTDRPGQAVGVKTADCVPMLVVARERRWIAAVHGGWRGLAGGVIEATATALRQAGATVDELRVAIGPHIGPCCYQVGPEVVAALHPSARVERAGALWADLAADACARWLAAGVAGAHLDVVGPCVACDAARFFSHRRDRGRTGRQLSAIALEAAR